MMQGSIASRAARFARATAPLAYLAALLIALLATAGLGAAPAVAQVPFECPTATTITWTRGAGTDLWTSPNNWDANRVPTTTDHVCVPDLAGTAVVYNTLTTTIASLSSDENLTISGGSLSLSGDLTSRKDLTLTNGTFAVAGVESTVGGKVTLSAGTLRVTGQLAADGPVSGQPAPRTEPARCWSRNGTAANDLTLSGTGTWSVNAGTVANEGRAVATGGILRLSGSSRFENRAGATFDAAGDFDIGVSFGPVGVFVNAGTFIKSAGGADASDIPPSRSTTPAPSTSRRAPCASPAVAGTMPTRAPTTPPAPAPSPSPAVTTLELAGTHRLGSGSSVTGDGNGHFVRQRQRLRRRHLRCRGDDVRRLGRQRQLRQGAQSHGRVYPRRHRRLQRWPLDIGQSDLDERHADRRRHRRQPVQLAVAGPVEWSAGTKDGLGTLLVRNGTAATDLTLSGTGSWSVNAGTVANEGRAVATGGILRLNGNSRFENRALATFDAAGDFDIGVSFGPVGVFVNAGTFLKSAGGADASDVTTVPFNNTGTVDVQKGTLRLAGGGRLEANASPNDPTSTGSFTVASLTTLELAGNHRLGSGSSVTGDGNGHFSGSGSVFIDGTYNVAGATTVASGGNVSFAKAVTLPGAFTLAGTAAFNGGPSTLANLTWTSGTLTVGGTTATPVQLAVAGPVEWSAGTKDGLGTLLVRNGTAATDLTLSGTGSWSVNAGTVANEGRAVATGGILRLNGNSRFENRALATFDAAGDFDIGVSFGPVGVFVNAGTFLKSAGGADASDVTTVPFNNTGTVDVQKGTLRLAGGGTHDGVFNVAAGATLNFDGGTHDLNFNGGPHDSNWAGDAIRGEGAMRVGGGVVHFKQALDTTNQLTLTGGTLDFDAASRLGGKLTWTNGTLDLGGDLAVDGGAEWTTGTKAGTGALRVADGPNTVDLTLSGTANKNINGGKLVNRGSAVASGTGDLMLGGNAAFENAPGATLELQADLDFGISFTGGSVLNEGTIRRSGPTGVLNIGSSLPFRQTSTGRLEVRIGGTAAGTDFDQISAIGAVTLGGTLAPSKIGGFEPEFGTPFPVLTYASRTGEFAMILGGFESAYGPRELVLSIGAANPVVNAGADGGGQEGSAFVRSGSFTNPGATSWTATVDYGDGTGKQDLALNPTNKTFLLNHVYADNGKYTITVEVTNNAGGVGSDDVEATISNMPPRSAPALTRRLPRVPNSPAPARLSTAARTPGRQRSTGATRQASSRWNSTRTRASPSPTPMPPPAFTR